MCSFGIFITLIYTYTIQANSLFPIQAFWSGKWANVRGQISFFRWATQAPSNVIDLSKLSQDHVLTSASIQNSPPSTRVIAATWLSHPWNAMELIKILIKLACEDKEDDAKQLLDIASRQSTELLLLGLLNVEQPWSSLHTDVVRKLISVFVVGHSSSVFVLTRVWQWNPEILTDVMVNLYLQDSSTLSRILDIAQELKAIPVLLENSNANFILDVASLSARREYLNLEKWLQGKMEQLGDNFIHICVEFVNAKLLEATKAESSVSLILLSEDAVSIFLRNLAPKVQLMDEKLKAAFKDTMVLASQLFPSIGKMNSVDDNQELSAIFSKKAEEEANLFFEKLYTGDLSVFQVIEMLKRAKTSPNAEDKEVLACVVHILFEEYRFFQKYPEKELAITGELFGNLIQHHLITPVRLALALRYVLDSLRRPLGTKLFGFGLKSLMQFQSRLIEWPQYSSHILQISHLAEAHPELIQTIQNSFSSIQSKNDSSDSKSVADDNGKLSKKNSNVGLGSLTTDSLVRNSDGKAFEVPSAATQEKILFMVNNVSFENASAKISELKKILKTSYFQWFADYLVVKRASIEPNFHKLYIDLLDGFARKELFQAVLNETFDGIKMLLASEKTATSSQERTLLKNLGSFLGAMTLGRDKPIKFRDLAVKELLMEGYQLGRLIVVIPFVCKVLEQCKDSKVFRPPNPWLMAILRLLVEFYQYADLKLNLKFEIEVMCKNIDVDLKEIEPAYLLFGEHGMAYVQPPAAMPANAAFGQNTLTNTEVPSRAANNLMDVPALATDENGNLTVINLESYVSFNGNLPLFNSHPALKKLVVLAVEQSIREIVTPVVERSVSIAIVATREMILKDFSNDPNDERMRSAAHLMSQNLAGNLAMVTSKDPFAKCFSTNLRLALQQQNVAEPMLEIILAATIPENSDLGSLIIEKAAMEKAAQEIEEAIAPEIMARKNHRERGIAWVDSMRNSGSRFPGILPEALKLRPGSAQQLVVYEEFMKPGISIPSPQASSTAVSPRRTAPQSQQEAQNNPLQQIMEKIAALLSELDQIIQKNATISLSNLPPQHEIITLVRQINVAASQFFVKDELALWFSQKLSQLLFKSEISLGIEIYIILLERICELSKRVARDFTTWLFFSPDDRKYNIKVSIPLIQSGLLNVLELDNLLEKKIIDGQVKATEFAVTLVHSCICSETPIVTFLEFYNTLGAIAQLMVEGKIPKNVLNLAEEIRSHVPGLFILPSDELIRTKEKHILLFEDWIQNYQSPENKYQSCITKLSQNNIIGDENALALFTRHATGASLESYGRLKSLPGGNLLCYRSLDALACLIVMVLEDLEEEKKVLTLSKIMSTIVLLIVHSHETKREYFDARPFYRLFSSILIELDSNEKVCEKSESEMLQVIARSLYSLRPSFAPGFVFAWLELVTHRKLMPKLLEKYKSMGWPIFQKLFIDLIQFLSPFLRHAEMTDPVRVLYKGTLRGLLLLLHDYPEFLCDCHFSFCDVVPPSCIQLRNLILSAFPKDMMLPDPFTPNLKVDMLPEIQINPQFLTNYTAALEKEELLLSFNSYLQLGTPQDFVSQLQPKLLLPTLDVYISGTNYNVPLINSIVLHAGVVGLDQMKSDGSVTITNSRSMDFYKKLASDLDTEGRYHFLNALANHLRYPNSHTHYFSCVLLYLFADSSQEIVKEQITRVLLERLIVNRPHPWGLLITFIELLKNPRYNFWSHSFTRCAPDIERLFESVARSCMLPINSETPVQTQH